MVTGDVNDEDDASLYARDPSRQSLTVVGRGPRLVLPPVAIVWRCPLSVEQYVAAGKGIEVPRPDCPDCAAPMRFRSGYWRDVRSGGGTGRPMWIRRAQCVPCHRSHSLVPSFLFERRLDAVEDIGAVVEAVTEGHSAVRSVADRLDVPYTTARDWVRRFSARASMLAAGFAALAVVVGAEGGIAALAVSWEQRTVQALRLVFEAVGPSSLSLWAVASVITGGKLLASTTDPPWTVLGDRRLMPPVP